MSDQQELLEAARAVLMQLFRDYPTSAVKDWDFGRSTNAGSKFTADGWRHTAMEAVTARGAIMWAEGSGVPQDQLEALNALLYPEE